MEIIPVTSIPHNWQIKNNKLFRSYNLDSFLDAIEFINKISVIAEKMNHHPNIFNVYSTVEIELFTHDENKITDKDYLLANEIEKI
ncbi:MAG: hypothetical protein GWO78_05340 [Dehalococcoidales bacterium]|jgi:4a-hydroxytetrahydrobiopterin dehydratase|nr:hypothetical protein [Dehalococcoidales bacterium]